MTNPAHQTSVEISQTISVRCPEAEDGIAVPISQWGRYMTRITECGDSSNVYEAVGWGCIGFASNALFAAATFPFGVTWIEQLANGGSRARLLPFFLEGSFAVFALAAGIAGLLSLHYARQHKSDMDRIRRIIVEDMQALQGSCLASKAAKVP